MKETALDRAIWHCGYFFKQCGLAGNSIERLDSMFASLFSIVSNVEGAQPYWEAVVADWLIRRPLLLMNESPT